MHPTPLPPVEVVRAPAAQEQSETGHHCRRDIASPAPSRQQGRTQLRPSKNCTPAASHNNFARECDRRRHPVIRGP